MAGWSKLTGRGASVWYLVPEKVIRALSWSRRWMKVQHNRPTHCWCGQQWLVWTRCVKWCTFEGNQGSPRVKSHTPMTCTSAALPSHRLPSLSPGLGMCCRPHSRDREWTWCSWAWKACQGAFWRGSGRTCHPPCPSTCGVCAVCQPVYSINTGSDVRTFPISGL